MNAKLLMLRRRHWAALLAILFGAFTYALLTVRAELLLGGGYGLISIRRIIATAIGALICWSVLRWILPRATSGSGGVIAVIATILPASLLVLGARLLVDEIMSAPTQLQENLRWVMVWTGYFGIWISAALAFNLHRARDMDSQVRSTAARSPATEDQLDTNLASWDWVADILTSMPEASKTSLTFHLTAHAEYLASEGAAGGMHDPRVILAFRIAERLSADPENQG